MAKKYTRAEWARIQSRFPQEDRVPWEQSPDAPEKATVASVRAKEAADAAAAGTTTAATTVDEQAKLKAMGVTGKTKLTAEQAAQISPSATAAGESGAIGAASIAAQIKAAENPAPVMGTANLTPEQLAQVNAALAAMNTQEQEGAAALAAALGNLDILSTLQPVGTVTATNTSTGGTTDGTDGGDGGAGGDGGPGEQPGKAWILSADGKRWVQPTKPVDGEYDWDDNNGWVKKTPPPPPGGKGFEFGPDGTLTNNGLPFTGTYNGKNYVNGVAQTTSEEPGNDGAGGDTYTFGPDGTLLKNGGVFTGTYLGKNYKDGKEVTSPNTSQTVVTGTDPAIKAALDALTAQLKAMEEAQKNVLTLEQIEKNARKAASTEFKDTLLSLGFTESDGIIAELDSMIQKDYTMAQIKLELPGTKAYKERFPGMEALRKAGRAINEATYISNEKGYLQTLRAYGLDTATLGSRSNLGVYIANEVSPREFEERVNLAATRVKENPDVMGAFKTFYPEADEGSVIAYLLNPKAGMDIIKKQVRISEIGAASTRAGFAKDLVSAEFATGLIGAVGESNYAQIVNEFSRARQFANAQRRLANIESQPYSDLEAVSAVVGDDIQAGLASQRRAEREVSRFAGRSGVTASSLQTANIGI